MEINFINNIFSKNIVFYKIFNLYTIYIIIKSSHYINYANIQNLYDPIFRRHFQDIHFWRAFWEHAHSVLQQKYFNYIVINFGRIEISIVLPNTTSYPDINTDRYLFVYVIVFCLTISFCYSCSSQHPWAHRGLREKRQHH